MRYWLQTIAFVWILIPFAISCTSVDEQKLAKVTALQAGVEEVKDSMTDVDIAPLRERANVAEKISRAWHRQLKDTIPLEELLILSDFKQDRKLLAWAVERHSKISDDIAITSTQLGNLRTDIEQNLSVDSTFQEAYSKEKAAVESMQQAFGELEERMPIALARYEKRIVQIKELMEKYSIELE